MGALFLFSVAGRSQTVGLLEHTPESLDDGYVLFAPIGSTTTYLIDKCGEQAKTWSSAYRPGQSVYLLPDGRLLRCGNVNNTTFNGGGRGGIIEIIDWDGTVSWSYVLSTTTICQHHDVRALPNGNVLAIVWESKTNAAAIAQGRNPALVANTLWSESILEIQPTGATTGIIVWEWHLWDHLVQDFDPAKPNYGVIADNPQLLDLNYNASATQSDWIHLNSVDYNPELDQILLSSHAIDEIWIIDHSTTTAEAASHAGGNSGLGGDLLYRWGNPAAYGNGAIGAQKLFGQHNARWIESDQPFGDHIMIFNNGLGRPGGNYSTVEVIEPPVSGWNYGTTLPYGPAATSWNWNYGNPNNYFAQNISGAQPLSNGNVLVTNGPAGTFTEVNTAGDIVWEYVNPVTSAGIIMQNATPTMNLVFRSTFYPSAFAGFDGQVLTPTGTIENMNSLSTACALTLGGSEIAETDRMELFPNPANDQLNVRIGSATKTGTTLSIFNNMGQCVHQRTVSDHRSVQTLPVGTLSNGIYLVVLQGDGVQMERVVCVAH